MKISAISCLFATGLISSLGVWGGARAHAAEGLQSVMVPLQGVIAPSQGFDSDDNVEAVVYGNLPNNCYTLGATKVRKVSALRFQVTQYATKRVDGICADEESMPSHLRQMVPFSKTVELGPTSAAGTLRIEYNMNSPAPLARNLEIVQSTMPSIDDLPYAAVTSVSTEQLVSRKDEIRVTISGFLNSTCTELDEKVRIDKVGDVYVILPVIKATGISCQQTLVPFSKTLSLGKGELGRHLIHVRSMCGKSVNTMIEVN